MNFSRMMSFMFGIIFIAILYFIIYYSLKIMYKDIKGGKRGKIKKAQIAHGLEVVKSSQLDSIRLGSIIPIRQTLTFGRKEDNDVVFKDQFISGYHAKIIIKNDMLYIEDLKSTNGTFINGQKIEGRVRIDINDEITLGNVIFKVID